MTEGVINIVVKILGEKRKRSERDLGSVSKPGMEIGLVSPVW